MYNEGDIQVKHVDNLSQEDFFSLVEILRYEDDFYTNKTGTILALTDFTNELYSI